MKISTSHTRRTLHGHSRAGLETGSGLYLYYLPHFIASPFHSPVSVPSYYHLISPFCSNPYVTADLEACTCSDCAGELRLGLGTQVGAERGSVPPYTSLRRFPVCVALKDLRRQRDLPRTLYVRLLVSCIFHFACGLRCPTRTGAAVPSCIFLISLLPPPQSTPLLGILARTPEFESITSYVFRVLVLLIVLFLELISPSREPGIYCTTRRCHRHDLDTLWSPSGPTFSSTQVVSIPTGEERDGGDASVQVQIL